jgi:hypothetical protein
MEINKKMEKTILIMIIKVSKILSIKINKIMDININKIIKIAHKNSINNTQFNLYSIIIKILFKNKTQLITKKIF